MTAKSVLHQLGIGKTYSGYNYILCAFELIKQDKMCKSYFVQIRKIADCVKSFGLNIDYFPTNFVVSGGLIYYIDYECNEYSDEWNFENWGIKYWSKTKEFLEHIKTLKEN
jgi:hypothetical protein